MVEQLERAFALKQKGGIDDEEYHRLKSSIISKPAPDVTPAAKPHCMEDFLASLSSFFGAATDRMQVSSEKRQKTVDFDATDVQINPKKCTPAPSQTPGPGT